MFIYYFQDQLQPNLSKYYYFVIFCLQKCLFEKIWIQFEATRLKFIIINQLIFLNFVFSFKFLKILFYLKLLLISKLYVLGLHYLFCSQFLDEEVFEMLIDSSLLYFLTSSAHIHLLFIKYKIFLLHVKIFKDQAHYVAKLKFY